MLKKRTRTNELEDKKSRKQKARICVVLGMKKKFGIENERLTDNRKVNNVLNGGSRRRTIIRAAITRQVEPSGN